MRTLGKSLVIYLIFFVGTAGLIHVDRQNAEIYRQEPQIMHTVENAVEFAMETAENTIEKYASLR